MESDDAKWYYYDIKKMFKSYSNVFIIEKKYYTDNEYQLHVINRHYYESGYQFLEKYKKIKEAYIYASEYIDNYKYDTLQKERVKFIYSSDWLRKGDCLTYDSLNGYRIYIREIGYQKYKLQIDTYQSQAEYYKVEEAKSKAFSFIVSGEMRKYVKRLFSK